MTCSRLIAVAAALIIPAAAMAETIEGEVEFTGKAPTPGKLHREADPFFAQKGAASRCSLPGVGAFPVNSTSPARGSAIAAAGMVSAEGARRRRGQGMSN